MTRRIHQSKFRAARVACSLCMDTCTRVGVQPVLGRTNAFCGTAGTIYVNTTSIAPIPIPCNSRCRFDICVSASCGRMHIHRHSLYTHFSVDCAGTCCRRHTLCIGFSACCVHTGYRRHILCRCLSEFRACSAVWACGRYLITRVRVFNMSHRHRRQAGRQPTEAIVPALTEKNKLSLVQWATLVVGITYMSYITDSQRETRSQRPTPLRVQLIVHVQLAKPCRSSTILQVV